MQEHRIVHRTPHSDPIAPQEEGDIIQSILEEFAYRRILKHRTYKCPALSFRLRISPIASALCTLVIEWNNKCKVWSGSESNASDSCAARFDVDRKQLTAADMVGEEASDVFKRWLGPDFNRWAGDMRGFLFIVDFSQVGDYCGSEFPLSVNRARMVSAQKLIPANAMSANSGRAP